METINLFTLETDAYKLVISADKMKALLWLKQVDGLSTTGEPPTYKDILRILNTNKVIFGLKQKELTEALVILKTHKKPSGMLIAAEGQQQIDGTPFEYRFSVPMTKPQIDDWIQSGSIDMIVRSEQPISKGKIALDITSGTRGREGRTVTGETIPFKSFPIIKVQPGLFIHTNDNRRFISEADGFLHLEKNYLSIIPFENMFMHVEVSQDEMEATIRMESDGLHTLIPSKEDIIENLKYSGVLSGIMTKGIELLIIELKNKTYDGTKRLIARGVPPKEGQSAKIFFHFNLNAEKISLMPDSYTYDAKHDSLFHKDSVVAEKERLIQPVDGFTVTNRRLNAHPVEDVSILTENFYITREDKKTKRILFINTVGGNASFRGKTLFLKPYQDASIELHPDVELLKMTIDFHPALGGGKTLLFDDVMKILDDEGYHFGINPDVIRSTLTRCQAEETPILNVLCAQGIPPVHGEDSKLKIYFKTSSELVIGEDITIDFKHRESVPHIKKDTLAAEIIPPTPGKPGTDIKDDPIFARDGELHPPVIGINMRQEGEKIFANIDGWPLFRKNTLSVLPYFETEGNVDYSTGNISFPGTVLVKGDVLPGFSVHALKGELIVKGNVTRATLRSSSNMLISGGIKGSDATCDGDFTAKFVEYSKVRVKGNLTILGSSLGNYLLSQNDIRLLKGKGIIIGGKTLASGSIEAMTIGNDVFFETILMAGEDFLTKNKMSKTMKIMKTIQESTEEMQNTLQKINHSSGNDANSQLINIKKRLSLNQHQLERLEKIKRHYQELIEKTHDMEKGFISVKNMIYPGSIISIKNAVIKINSPMTSTRFTFDKDTQKMTMEKAKQK